ncbi:MAG: ImmA/IrrE family metallo-endopeptidase [Clostridia bacterium]|nr:ImmA/IrrE family metallo-endopeptidase [Clostridia bacterium]
MNTYKTRAELDELSEGLITLYLSKCNQSVPYIDIEKFITDFLNLKIQYVSFAEDDKGKAGFLANGATPLLIYHKKKIVPFVFPDGTILIDKFLLSNNESNRKRFALAHEASHYILNRVQNAKTVSRFNNSFDSEKVYTTEEFKQMFNSAEWQADNMAASLLMPIPFIENAINNFTKEPIKIYGKTTFTNNDKVLLREIANYLKVSYTALVIRIKNTSLLEHHDISEYIAQELNLGGTL